MLGVLSHWQDDPGTPNPPDLSKADGIDCFRIKVGQGANEFDPLFKTYVTQAQALDVPWMGGWWPEPNESDPADQAAKLWYVANTLGPPTGPPWLDIEDYRGPKLPPAQLGRWYRTMIDELKRMSGRDRIAVYTADWFWDVAVYPSGIDFSDCDLIVAEWLDGLALDDPSRWEATVGDRRPDPVKGFGEWCAWQISCSAPGAVYGAESSRVCINVVKPDAFDRWFGG